MIRPFFLLEIVLKSKEIRVVWLKAEDQVGFGQFFFFRLGCNWAQSESNA